MNPSTPSAIKIFPWNQFPLPWKRPQWSAQIKSCAEDFIVDEKLDVERKHPTNAGPESSYEHLYLQVQKKYLNSLEVVAFLADYFQVPLADIHYAGLKDKHALTRQWFSVRLPGKKAQIDIQLLKNFNLYLYAFPGGKPSHQNSAPAFGSTKANVACKILQAKWRPVALKKGGVGENQFIVVLRGDGPVNSAVKRTLEKIRESGFANYYGSQRFGHQGQNLQRAIHWFKTDEQIEKEQQSRLLSSVRSFLFNQVLANRVISHQWKTPEPGDYCLQKGCSRFFILNGTDRPVQSDPDPAAVHPAVALFGNDPIFGKDKNETTDAAVYRLFPDLCEGLAKWTFKHRVRALRVIPQKFSWEIEPQHRLRLKFSLPSGSYATTLIQHLGHIRDTFDQ